MKHYIIILIPEEAVKETIGNFRATHTGNPLIDGLPPHVTLKTRFYLREGVLEDDLKKIFNEIDIQYTGIVLDDATMFNDAFVLRGDSDYIRRKHLEVRELLASSVVDVRPEFEGDNFKMHLTVWRGERVEVDSKQFKGEIKFNKVCLYEIDPTSKRAFANRIACKELM